MSAFKMPWGRYKGMDIADVPTDYLVWLRGEAKNLSPRFRKAIDDDLDWRWALCSCAGRFALAERSEAMVTEAIDGK